MGGAVGSNPGVCSAAMTLTDNWSNGETRPVWADANVVRILHPKYTA